MKRVFTILAALAVAGVLLSGILVGLVVLNAEPPRKPTGKYPIEFRILADRRHDREAAETALAPGGLEHPPAGYQWVKLDPRAGLDSDPDAVVRLGTAAGVRSILVQLDRYNVNARHIANVYPTADEHLRPAIGFQFNTTAGDRLRPAIVFQFNPAGADLFGRLTREHLPEQDGAFKYRVAIILDHSVITAPMINSEIRDRALIEGGNDGFTAAEIKRLIALMTR